MKILPIVNYSNLTKLERKENKTQSNPIENKNVNLLNTIQDNRYLINFCANNENLEKIYQNYGKDNGMPISFDRYLANIPKEEREKRKDTYASYRSVYADMENCHTTTRLKELFPEEFENIKSAFSLKDNKGSFLYKIKEWASVFEGSDQYLFEETKDNDLAVYLAKKIYLEAKTKKEIKEDFIKDINKSIFTEEDIETLKNQKSGELIPDSVYTKLGLRGDFKSNGFRHSLCLSRQDYIEKYGSIYKSKRKENFEKVLEKVIETKKSEKTEKTHIPKKHTGNYEKMQYIMFYVWNNSLELRRALSNFLIDKKEGNELLIPDLMKITTESDKNTKQYKLMAEFWEKYPEFRNYFSEKCKEGFEVIEKAIDNGTFEMLKEEIDTKRMETFLILREEKEKKELEIEILEREKRIEKEIQEEKELIKKDLLSAVDKYKQVKPVPPLLAREMKEKILEVYNKMFDINKGKDKEKNLEELKNIIDINNSKIEYAILKLVKDIISLDKESFYEKTREKFKKHYGNFFMDKGLDKNGEDDFHMGINVFSAMILEKYLIYLYQFPKGEVPKESRRKKLNSLMEELKQKEDYDLVLTNDVRKYMVSELTKRTFEIAPKKLLDMYNKIFVNMKGDLSEES